MSEKIQSEFNVYLKAKRTSKTPAQLCFRTGPFGSTVTDRGR
jgi:hypothetical protein